MKTKQKNEIRQKSLPELKELLKELIQSKNQLKINLSKEKNKRAYKTKRAEIAFVKTLIREKELEASYG